LFARFGTGDRVVAAWAIGFTVRTTLSFYGSAYSKSGIPIHS